MEGTTRRVSPSFSAQQPRSPEQLRSSLVHQGLHPSDLSERHLAHRGTSCQRLPHSFPFLWSPRVVGMGLWVQEVGCTHPRTPLRANHTPATAGRAPYVHSPHTPHPMSYLWDKVPSTLEQNSRTVKPTSTLSSHWRHLVCRLGGCHPVSTEEALRTTLNSIPPPFFTLVWKTRKEEKTLTMKPILRMG